MTRQDSDQTLNPDLAAAEARCASSRKHVINQPRATVWVWERSPIQGRTTCVLLLPKLETSNPDHCMSETSWLFGNTRRTH